MPYIIDINPDTGNPGNYNSLGYDSSIPEFKRQGQSFTVGAQIVITGAEIYARTNSAATGENLDLRIETDNSNKPSGTLADANLTVTLSGFNDTAFGYRAGTFATPGTLATNTKYWLVAKSSSESGTAAGYRLLLSSPANAYTDGAYSQYASAAWSTQAVNDEGVRVAGTIVGGGLTLNSRYW